jgi:nitrogen regulatory protein PII
MKLAFIVYGSPIDPDVTESLETLGLHSYTKWREVLGKGRSSGPHLDTHVWPGTNSVIMVVLADDRVDALVEALKPLKQRLSHEGLKLYLLPAEEAL